MPFSYSTEKRVKVSQMIAALVLEVHPDESPIGYVRSLHVAWKIRDGKVDGKPRHSDRYLSDLLAKQGFRVRSLVPKLRGTTKLQSLDAEALVKVFLTNWDLIDGAIAQGGMSPEYDPIFSSDRIIDVSSFIAQKIELDLAQQQAVDPLLPHGHLMRDLFRKADALITVSSQQTLITVDPRRALIGFRNLMTDLWEIDREQPSQQGLLIWVLDLGQLSFDDLESRLGFLNVWALIGRFKSLELFNDKDRDERWRWLCARAVIVIRDTQRVDRAPFGGLELEGQHFLPRAIPEGWAISKELRRLYGVNLERIDDRNYSLFLRHEGWESSLSSNRYLRYFGVRPPQDATRSESARQAYALELPSPGDLYDMAFRIVYSAAVKKLGLDKPTTIDRNDALELLASRGFRVLSLDDFMKL